MKLRILFIAFAVMVGVAGATGQKKVELLVKDINVFDPASGAFVPHRDIVVSGTRISAVLPTGQYSGSAKTIIKGSGKYAIPGLFDNHVHMARMTEETASLFLVSGITSVRDMGTVPARIVEWRRRITHGKFYGPRIVQACGPMLESKGEERIDHWVIKGPEEADSVIGRIAEAGMDCVKLRSYADEKTYLAIAAAAKKYKLMLVGHAPESLDPQTALRAGQKTFEHAFYPYPMSKLSDEQKAALFAAFRTSGAALVPTLIAWRPFTQATSELETMVVDYRKNPEFSLPDELLAHWDRTIETHRSQKRGSKGWQDAVATASSDVGEMYRAGVKVLPGSDSGAPFVVPGLSLHEELGLLVRAAGMTPAEVLAAATLRSAEFYGRSRDLGSIEPGKIGDIVILTADPLADIANTRKIDAVVFRGEALTRAHLNKFMAETKRKEKIPEPATRTTR